MLPDIDYVDFLHRTRGNRLRVFLCAVALLFCVVMVADLAVQDSLLVLLN